MNLQTSAFHSDNLTLTRWELVKLFFGATLKTGPLIVKAAGKK